MNVKRFWLGCLAVFVAEMVLGFIIHTLWLGSTYMSLAEIWRPQAELVSKQWIMLVTAAVFAIFFCYIFVRGYENRGVMEGVRFGAIIGLFYTLPHVYDTYVIFPLPYHLALKWFLSGMVVSIVLGVIIALIYKPAEAAG